MKFDFNEVMYLNILKEPMSDDEFKATFRADKRALVSNVLWRNCPNAEIAEVCLGILKNYSTEISTQSLTLFHQYIDEAIGSFPLKAPLLKYIDSLLEAEKQNK